MSRIGKAPIIVDSSVQVSVSAQNEVLVKGAKNSLKIPMKPEVTVKVEGNKLTLIRSSETKAVKSLHGMYRALLANAIKGVTTGFTRTLEMHGVGYRATVNGKKLELSLGFSHPIEYSIPEGIEMKVDKQTTIVITGPSREVVGQVAAEIRSFRPPEPYLGKGVRYQGEHIRRKAGKSAGK